MNKKISLGAAISFMAVVAAITFTVTMIFSLNIFNDKVYNVKEREELYKKVSEIDHLIRQNYVGELDEQYLLDALSGGFVTGTADPYAKYYDAAKYSRLQEIEKGELVGIGAELARDDSGYIHINSVYTGSPAESAGLAPGDLIVSIGEQDVKAISYEKALDLLIDAPGTRVSVTYRRESVDNTCEVIRKTFEIPAVTMEMLDDGNAYVRISAFSTVAERQLQTVVNKLTAEEVTGIVFDLRNTHSGSLSSACEMLNMLVPLGELLSVTYKDGSTQLLKRSDSNELNLPMITLVNGKTQYAAELFAANLSDYNKSKLVGAKTYGQGVMQETYQLKDGSGVVLSSAFFSPAISGNFNGTGLLPDYEVSLSTEAEKSLTYGKLAKEEDTQLSKALEVLSVAK